MCCLEEGWWEILMQKVRAPDKEGEEKIFAPI